MKRLIVSFALAAAMLLPANATKHEFTTVPGDPLNTKIYTLPNGLKVFMTVNPQEPRIQTYVAVRVGGKNDPAETTGLAHYFEHLMFKGTEQFGTSNYAAEKPLLDRIEALFEDYRHTTDSVARAKIYHEIDSVSYEASKIAIPNEYDKLMSAIGANGTNAYTSYDVTCYVEDIPSNQIENWAKIQADRFANPIIRGFHTELETIYEEKNMSLTRDSRKVYEKILSTLYPSHPYGSQTVLGTQEHLKNPSITNVKAYHKQWYVPNNMAIALSGDFDPDTAVDIIEKYFGALQPNPNLPRPALPNEAPITEPIDVEVLGPEAENITLVWRLPQAADKDYTIIEAMDMILCNGRTGLIDLNVSLPQRTLSMSSYAMPMADAGAYVMSARPKKDQSLDDARAIILEQVAKLRNGEFSESLVEAVKANIKLQRQQALIYNSQRADQYVDAFVNGIDWADLVAELPAIDKVTKADIVAAANKYLGDNNYAAIYKRQGTDPNEVKLPKPQLTPIEMNRDLSSDFLRQIQGSTVEPIEPHFLDFKKDLKIYHTASGAELIYTVNEINNTSTINFVYDLGSYAKPMLNYVPQLLQFCGTSDMTPEQVKDAFYSLACDYSYSSSGERTYFTISGLSENMPAAMELFEKFIGDARLSDEAYQAYIDRIEKSRLDAKHNQSANFSHLAQYVTYGPVNPATANELPIDSLRAINPQDYIDALRSLDNYQPTIIYWGKEAPEEVIKLVDRTFHFAANPLPYPTEQWFKPVQPEETVFYVSPYEAKQLYLYGYSNRGDVFDPAKESMLSIYNEYFGGNMSSIVFQEMRESRSLAYSAGAWLSSPSRPERTYSYGCQIATQNDKLIDALSAFDEIINNMPMSEAAFSLAIGSLDARLRTLRYVNNEPAFLYINKRRLGYDHDPNAELFDAIQNVTLDDVLRFQKENVKDRVFHYGILAEPKNIDVEALKKLGRVVELTQEDIFGY